jgi:hypothetical protein
MVGHRPLEASILVRIQVPQPMKKIFLSLLVVLGLALILNVNLAVAATTKAKSSTVKTQVKAKTKVVKSTSKYKTTMKWDASGLKYLSNGAHFDYSSAVRNAVIKKIENYAKRNKIKLITLAVINSMRE